MRKAGRHESEIVNTERRTSNAQRRTPNVRDGSELLSCFPAFLIFNLFSYTHMLTLTDHFQQKQSKLADTSRNFWELSFKMGIVLLLVLVVVLEFPFHGGPVFARLSPLPGSGASPFANIL
jgi:hypothetical protein